MLEVPRARSHCSAEFFVTIPRTTGDRSGDVLRVTCPHCKFPNEYQQFDMRHIVICEECRAPVAVDDYQTRERSNRMSVI